MVTRYSNYIVEVKNVKFIADDGRSCQRTAIVTFLDKKGEEIGSELFGAVEINHIYNLIKEGENINLDNYYIPEFSLSFYRQHNNIEKKELVAINGFSARNAFFDAKVSTDFTYTLFSDGEVSFDGSHFAKGKVLFAGSVFGKGNVIFSNTLFRDGNIEFTGVIFGEGDFMFKNAIVKDGIKDFQDIQFGHGEVSFANTEFNSGELLFINTRFNSGRFNFKVTRIAGGKVDFHYSVFGDCEITFERTEFGNSRVDFRTVDFGSGRINFNRSVFGNGEVNFEGASCKAGKIQFKKAEMGSGPKNFNLMEMDDTDVSFERTDFGDGNVSFYESKFHSISLKSCHLDHYFDLRLDKAELLDVSDTIVRDIVDMEPYDFPVEINSIDMSGMRLIGKLYIDWRHNKCNKSISNQEGTTLRQKAEQFRILKENFNSTGKYEDEDEAYIMFKRFEARSWLTEQEEKGGIIKLASYIPHSFKWLVFDKIGLYATSPGRVLLSVVVFWFIFGLVYFSIDLSGFGKTVSSVGNPDQLSTLIQSFYHSAITFFTIGYGDVYPMGLSRIISGVEGFMGVFMMSYFTVAFVRKILR
ncbi:MAG TPA: potassium channel family protein [Bacteroidales bacterium]|nr:potassium channel family protein [Bacteroidales bacterium]